MDLRVEVLLEDIALGLSRWPGLEATPTAEATPEALLAQGLVSKGALIKVLGRGEITRAVTVHAHAWSASAEAAITAAGGSLEKLPLPFSVRPPSSGNAHMNR